MKEWGPFQSWVEQVGQQAVVALNNLQAALLTKNKTLLPYHLRCFHGLFTPEARLAVLNAMAAPKAGLDEVNEAAERASAEQWYNFVWRKENKKLHKDTGACVCVFIALFLLRTVP